VHPHTSLDFAPQPEPPRPGTRKTDHHSVGAHRRQTGTATQPSQARSS